jgi:hypothetical protein
MLNVILMWIENLRVRAYNRGYDWAAKMIMEESYTPAQIVELITISSIGSERSEFDKGALEAARHFS